MRARVQTWNPAASDYFWIPGSRERARPGMTNRFPPMEPAPTMCFAGFGEVSVVMRRPPRSGGMQMSLGLILVIILIIVLLGGFSGRFGGYGYGMGHSGMGLGGLILVVLIILLLLGKL
jgi:hypothetical protein